MLLNFQNRKWNHSNKKWNCFSHFQAYSHKTFFDKIWFKITFKIGNKIIKTENGINSSTYRTLIQRTRIQMFLIWSKEFKINKKLRIFSHVFTFLCYYVILCYIMLHFAILCYIMLYHVISCYITSYYVESCHIKINIYLYVILFYIMLYYVISLYYIISFISYYYTRCPKKNDTQNFVFFY